MIKDLAPFLATILTELFNRTIDENEYPDALKLTKLIELYKAKVKITPTLDLRWLCCSCILDCTLHTSNKPNQ